MPDDLKQWSKLLQAIAKGVVIPIVGRDLLRITVDGREQLLYEYLPKQLAIQLNVKCDPSASLDQVVAAYLNSSSKDDRNDRTDVNVKALEILNQLRDAGGQFPVPEPLRKLSTIQPLRLFISTTVDSLLANALGSPPTHVFAYSPISKLADIPRDYDGLPDRLVFHLFGKLSGISDSALVDEETLEFIWRLHEESMSTRLENLFDELRTKHLLLIGNAHPDWLARFFVRLNRSERLNSGAEAREFVADGAVVADVHLRDFLENFSPQTRSFGVANPIDFVDQLAERWAAFPDKPVGGTSEAGTILGIAKPPGVFVSYASEDLQAAERLRASLTGAGLDVWFDKRRLESGDPFWPIIKHYIASCDVFVPVISANSNKRDRGVFIREWNCALEALNDMDKATASFIHPVFVDDTAKSSFTGFEDFHYARARGGEAQDDFIKTLTAVVRERRLKAAGQ
jgi:hypothetical protein